MLKNTNNGRSKQLDDSNLEAISGGRSSQVKIYNVTKGICECIIKVDNGKVLDISFPSDDKECSAAKKNIRELYYRGIVNEEEIPGILSALNLRSML